MVKLSAQAALQRVEFGMELLQAAASLAEAADHDWAGRVVVRIADLLVEPVLERMQNGRSALKGQSARDRKHRDTITDLGVELYRMRLAWESDGRERRNAIVAHRDLLAEIEVLKAPIMWRAITVEGLRVWLDQLAAPLTVLTRLAEVPVSIGLTGMEKTVLAEVRRVIATVRAESLNDPLRMGEPGVSSIVAGNPMVRHVQHIGSALDALDMVLSMASCFSPGTAYRRLLTVLALADLQTVWQWTFADWVTSESLVRAGNRRAGAPTASLHQMLSRSHAGAAAALENDWRYLRQRSSSELEKAAAVRKFSTHLSATVSWDTFLIDLDKLDLRLVQEVLNVIQMRIRSLTVKHSEFGVLDPRAAHKHIDLWLSHDDVSSDAGWPGFGS